MGRFVEVYYGNVLVYFMIDRCFGAFYMENIRQIGLEELFRNSIYLRVIAFPENSYKIETI